MIHDILKPINEKKNYQDEERKNTFVIRF